MHAPGDPLFNTGRFTAEKVGTGWNISAVEFDSDWRKLGLPKDRFVHDLAVLYDAKTDGPRVLSDWSKQVAAYRQTILAPPPVVPASAPAAANPAPAFTPALPSNSGQSLAPANPPPLPPSETATASLEPAPPLLAPAPAAAPPEPATPEFQPDDLILNCTTSDPVGNSTRFDSLFRNRTYTFSGTVARLNPGEGLVVFRGGGVYPQNWNLQLASSNPSAYTIGRPITVRFRLTKMIVVPFGGISFRGDHLRHKNQPIIP